MLHSEIVNEWADTDRGIEKELKSKGYKFLGAGVDQMAFADPHNPNAVLKIFGTQEGTKRGGISGDHKMLYVWAKFCQKNSSNPYLPKFYGVATFRWKDRTYLQISQEKLVKNKKFTENVTQSLVNAVEMGYDFEGWMKKEKPGAFNWGNTEYSYGKERKISDMFADPGQVKQLEEFYNTVERLYSISQDNGYTFDLHEGNIMARSDGTPVITDPWVLGSYAANTAYTEPNI
jgi:hypothetical protein